MIAKKTLEKLVKEGYKLRHQAIPIVQTIRDVYVKDAGLFETYYTRVGNDEFEFLGMLRKGAW